MSQLLGACVFSALTSYAQSTDKGSLPALILKNAPQWESLANELRPGELKVNYQDGKTIENDAAALLKDIRHVAADANAVQQHHRFADELFLLQDLDFVQKGFETINGDLSLAPFEVENAPKWIDWKLKVLQAEHDSIWPIRNAWFSHLTERASDLDDHPCIRNRP